MVPLVPAPLAAASLAAGPRGADRAVAGLSIIVPGATGGERAHVTVSIGWPRWPAAASADSERMATVGAALSRAESGGRDQVQMIGTTWGLSAISGGNRGGRGGSAGAGSTGGSRTDVPIALRRAQFS